MNAFARQACVDYHLSSGVRADEIEQVIIRAYIRLVSQDVDTDNSRPIVVRIGPLDVHLSDIRPKDVAFGLPPFWIEVFDGVRQASIDSIGFLELDDAELASAVEMIVSATGSRQSMIPPSG
ncbi:hypothetical protein [Microvirga yunnanensis]|uniref:hypothetical protein n=1 Tax=Microvirga yunnanensis TaxID=2953740 RepID=UPI0021C9EA67|nr:hypothetical protein [Microvirga sp. HBU65207]